MKQIFKNNGLSIVLVLIFFFCLFGQVVTGFKEHNNELTEDGGTSVTLTQYFSSGHFIETTFENWESEFLQMGMFVVLSAFLFQRGSSESKDPDNPDEAKPVPDPSEIPWPVKKGGFIKTLYSYSLSIAFFMLFLLSFVLHWLGSNKAFNQEQMLKGEPTKTAWEYLSSSRLWFESFQNWQSEFLAVFAMVVLSIFLRHKGSAQSKEITDPDSKTGE